ncbi:Lysophospholipase 1 [Exophiala dermatitidis]
MEIKMHAFHTCFLILGIIYSSLAYDLTSYAPVRTSCPNRRQWVRPAQGLSSEEAAWVQGRKPVVLDAFSAYLKRLNITDLDVSGLVNAMKKDNNSGVPTISMAISGGGWGSAMTGIGILRAFDARFADAINEQTGGLLQSMTYIAGLSGGSWPVMSLSTYNFPSINDLVANWHTDIDRSTANNTVYAANTTSLFMDVAAKYEAGFNVSVPDYLGRSFSYEFLPPPNGGLNITLSSITNLSNFKNHSMPMPLFQANRLTDDDIEFFGIKVPYGNSSIIEMNPFELGAWQGSAGSATGFMPTEYLGTVLQNGSLSNSSECVVGYDRASFMMGVAASAFNFWYIEARSNGTLASFSKRAVQPDTTSAKHQNGKRTAIFPAEVVDELLDSYQEYLNLSTAGSMYPSVPNPFAGMQGSNGPEPSSLQLADGSEAGQSIPYWGLIQPSRQSDFIISWDSDSDQPPFSWNNGTNIYNTYLQARRNGLPFPEVPPPSTFIKRNYTSKPVFFGCDTQYTTTRNTSSPIVLYLTNTPYSAYTNYTWYQDTFTPVQMHEILVNSFNIATQGNGTLDPEWAQCLGCAAIDRSIARLGIQRVDQCEKCLRQYCWDGTYENEADIPLVDLLLKLYPNVTYAEWNATHGWDEN